MFKNPYFRVATFAAIISAALATAGGIKTWNSGDTLDASDINANFQHIHNAMVGGHGARLTNSDVSSSANIGYTKIQNGRGIARAWADVEGTCSGVPPIACTVDESLNITSITKTATGQYTAVLGYTATDNVYLAIAHSFSSTVLCWAQSASTTQVTIVCSDYDAAIGPTATDAAFGIVVYDGD